MWKSYTKLKYALCVCVYVRDFFMQICYSNVILAKDESAAHCNLTGWGTYSGEIVFKMHKSVY